MTFPIPFTTTPHDGGADNADAEDAFGQVATATDVNFAKINTFLRSWKPTFASTFQVQTPLTSFNEDSTWHDFDGAVWPACAIVLPPKPAGLMVGVGAYVQAISNDAGFPQLWVTVRLNGAGGYAHEPYDSMVGGRSVAVGQTRIFEIPASYLTGGTTVTVTPQYLADQVGADHGMVQGGHLWTVALV